MRFVNQLLWEEACHAWRGVVLGTRTSDFVREKDLTFPFETSVLSPSLLMLKQRFSNLADNL